ncbi:hypothetical protein A3D76_00545 [Candidatus Roizmanbacteria bacterium RIFCSPHIGHO2_02_FULL_37_9b]|nr:MAG: hypothetical protein A3D76_00545 [Candidatus Roizmanbacteria bacterium RIFCSPHIGHO2_02_FULL_37_9b]
MSEKTRSIFRSHTDSYLFGKRPTSGGRLKINWNETLLIVGSIAIITQGLLELSKYLDNKPVTGRWEPDICDVLPDPKISNYSAPPSQPTPYSSFIDRAISIIEDRRPDDPENLPLSVFRRRDRFGFIKKRVVDIIFSRNHMSPEIYQEIMIQAAATDSTWNGLSQTELCSVKWVNK